jgi:hypothetical protein
MYGKPAANIKVQLKLSNSNDTMGNTIYDPSGNVVQVTTDGNGKIEYYWDNTTSNTHYTTLSNNKTYYLHYKSGTAGWSDIYGGTPIQVGDGYQVIVYGGSFMPDNVIYKTRVLDHMGNPLQGVQCTVKCTTSSTSLNTTQTTDNNGYIELIRDYSATFSSYSGTYTRRYGTLKVTTGNQTINGVYYEAKNSSAKIWIYTYKTQFVPQQTTITTTQYGSAKLESMVYLDHYKEYPAISKEGFKVMDYYTGSTLPTTYSTNSTGMLSETITTNQDAKWYTHNMCYVMEKKRTHNMLKVLYSLLKTNMQ